MLVHVNSFLRQVFALERSRIILWLPVIYGSGVAVFFSLKFEPKIWLLLVLCAAVSVVFIILRLSNYHKFSFIFLTLFIFLLGLSVTTIKSSFSATSFIKEKTGPLSIRGVIEFIEPQNTGTRVTLKNIDIWKWQEEATPKKIRLSVRTKMAGAVVGDKVSLRAILYPPPRPSYPGGYDAARMAYFNHIGAYGFTISDFKMLEKSRNNTIGNWVANLRLKISERIFSYFPNALNENKPSDKAALAIALFVGEQNALSKTLLEEMRASGLFHIVSISGLHMAIVMGTSFFILRFLFSLSEKFTLTTDIKKWAALFAIICGGFYLLISGAPVPAVRSYVMAALFFLAVIINRTSSVLIPVAFAAFLILVIEPEAILSASFQMSFAAVTALAAAFEIIKILDKELISQRGKMQRFFLYFAGIIFSSVIAGFATAPFVIHHFNEFQIYGVISNLLAVPITSFIIMPFGMLSLILMPLSLEGPALYVTGVGIDMVIAIAKYVSNLPSATLHLKSFYPSTFMLIIIGGLWLCLWQGDIRFLGAAIIIMALLIPRPSTPDVIIDGSGKLFAVKDEKDELYFSSLTFARTARKIWAEKNATAPNLKIANFPSENNKLECNDKACIYSAAHKIVLVKTAEAISSLCDGAYMVFFLAGDGNCNGEAITVNSTQLNKAGTHVVNFSQKNMLKTVADKRGKRAWALEGDYE